MLYDHGALTADTDTMLVLFRAAFLFSLYHLLNGEAASRQWAAAASAAPGLVTKKIVAVALVFGIIRSAFTDEYHQRKPLAWNPNLSSLPKSRNRAVRPFDLDYDPAADYSEQH